MRISLSLALAAAVLASAALFARAQSIGISSAFHARSSGPVWESLPGDAVFWDQVPENVRQREKVEKRSLASNEVARVEGEFQLDIHMPDPTGLTEKKPSEVVCRFTRKDGGKWSFKPSPDAVEERSSLGAAQGAAFGDTGKGTPLEPKQRAVVRLRGKGRLEKDGKTVSSDVPFNLVVGSRTRDPETGKYLGGYGEVHEGLEVKLVIPETFPLPDGTKGLTIVFANATARD